MCRRLRTSSSSGQAPVDVRALLWRSLCRRLAGRAAAAGGRPAARRCGGAGRAAGGVAAGVRRAPGWLHALHGGRGCAGGGCGRAVAVGKVVARAALFCSCATCSGLVGVLRGSREGFQAVCVRLTVEGEVPEAAGEREQ